jgi:hypothetical protein
VKDEFTLGDEMGKPSRLPSEFGVVPVHGGHSGRISIESSGKQLEFEILGFVVRGKKLAAQK